MIEIGKVLESTGALIKIKLNDVESFENNKESLKVGKYLTIQEGNLNYRQIPKIMVTLFYKVGVTRILHFFNSLLRIILIPSYCFISALE